MRIAAQLLVLLLTLGAAGCGDDDDSGSGGEGTSVQQSAGEGHVDHVRSTKSGETPEPTRPRRDPDAPSAGGVTWEAPAPFQAQRPSSNMRVAEYLFPEEVGETPALMTVFFFGTGQGGGVEQNVERWVAQFAQPEGQDSSEAAEITREEVSGMPVTIVDVTGTFTGGRASAGPTPPRTDQRLLGAIIEGPQGPVFFKLIGDVSVMERAEGPFREFVASMRAL